MAFNVSITELPSPQLEFGAPGLYINPKIGLIESGPFDLRFGSARKEQIRVGLIGPNSEIINGSKWLERCKGFISSGTDSRLNTDFHGFKTVFRTALQTDSRLNVDLDKGGAIATAMAIKDDLKRFESVLALYDSAIGQLVDSNLRPDVIVCCLSEEIFAGCASVSRSLSKAELRNIKQVQEQSRTGQLGLFDELDEEFEEEGLLKRDFRRALKAAAMKHRMPIQLGRNGLFLDSHKNQDPATRAWNFTVAMYYKAGGIPWRLHDTGPETCFVGISFHHFQTTKRNLVYSSLAQAFSSKGDGFAIKGDSVPWDPRQGKSLHLSEDQAYDLGTEILNQYDENAGGQPLRVVVHKTSNYSEEETKGFHRAFENIPVVELINLKNTSFRLVQTQTYPPKRGTLCEVNDTRHFLFTTGFMSELGTYPGPHIPAPIEIVGNGTIDVHRAAKEVLGLTRMNWNTASMTGGQPITFSFARKVGGIIAEFGDDFDSLQHSFRYFI